MQFYKMNMNTSTFFPLLFVLNNSLVLTVVQFLESICNCLGWTVTINSLSLFVTICIYEAELHKRRRVHLFTQVFIFSRLNRSWL